MRRLRAWLLAAIGVSAAACQAGAAQGPATLESADAATMERLRSVLAQAMDRASVQLGPGDPTASSTISVLPPPLGPREDRSLVTPTQFDIMKDGERCFLVRRDTGEEFDLDDVACRAVD